MLLLADNAARRSRTRQRTIALPGWKVAHEAMVRGFAGADFVRDSE
jgi:hypothetical protein